MKLSEQWRSYIIDNCPLITPFDEYYNSIEYTQNIFKNIGISIPAHLTVIFPPEFGINKSNEIEQPVTYHQCNAIFLFPRAEDNLIYQYIHELCHVLIGDFNDEYRWIGELLACSCNYFLYPKNIHQAFYDFNMTSQILSIEQNKINFQKIQPMLIQQPSIVYGNCPIESTLFAYNLEHPDFDFISLLKDFIQSRFDPQKRFHLINRILQIFEPGYNPTVEQ